MDTTTLKLRGMSCASCANNIEQAIRTVPGVAQADVNFGAEQATVTYDPQRTGLEVIQNAISEAGYSAFSLQESEMVTGEDDAEKTARQAESRDLTRKVWVGAIVSAILLIGSLPMMTGLNLPLIPDWLHNFWFQAILTAPSTLR